KADREEYQSIHDDAFDACPECSSPAFGRVPTLPHTTMREYRTPIEMDSIAMNTIEEIREFKRKAPDVPVSEAPNDERFGIPVANTRHAKLQALNAAGYEERN